MSVIIILIIISVIVAIFFLGIFIWAVKTGQFDDTVSPSIRILIIFFYNHVWCKQSYNKLFHWQISRYLG